MKDVLAVVGLTVAFVLLAIVLMAINSVALWYFLSVIHTRTGVPSLTIWESFCALMAAASIGGAFMYSTNVAIGRLKKDS